MSYYHESSLYAIIGSFLGLSTLSVGLRFYARRKRHAPLLIDDWCIVIALCGFYALAGLVLKLIELKNIGDAIAELTPEQLNASGNTAAVIQEVLNVATIICLGFSKASALFLYRRLLVPPGPGYLIFKYLVLSSLPILAAWSFTFIFLSLYQCHGHFSNLQLPQVFNKYCTLSIAFLYGFVVSDVILDAWVLILPIPRILKLHITPAKKVSIIAIFLLASVGLGGSIARMLTYIQIEQQQARTKHAMQSGSNPTQDLYVIEGRFLAKFYFFYILECGTSIIAVNLPNLAPLASVFGLDRALRLMSYLICVITRTSKSSKPDENLVHGSQRFHKANSNSKPFPQHDSETDPLSSASFGETSSEAYAMRKLNGPQLRTSESNGSAIQVHKSIDVSHSRDGRHGY